MKSIWMFRRLYEPKAGEVVPKIWAKYWNSARLVTDAREATLRFAAYKWYLDDLRKNNGVPTNFGGSIPQEIMGLSDIRDRAFWLSNDLLGPYDRVSVTGQALRDHMIPFWSWQEVNMKRYKRFIQNEINDPHAVRQIGWTLGAKTPILAYRLGRLAIKMTAFVAALEVWNKFVMGEIDQDVPEEVKARPHITLGRDAGGEAVYFSRIGALGDALAWFGTDGVIKEVREYLNGKMTLKETLQSVALEAGKGTLNQIVQGALPFEKLAAEIAGRRTYYPDVTSPGTVRDRWEHLFRSFGLENEYRLLAEKPSRGYGRSLKGAFVYETDPGESSYRHMQEVKSEFMKKIGRESEGFWITPKGDALFNFKLSVKYGDEKAAKKYLEEYIKTAAEQGMDGSDIKKGIQLSLRNMHPLANVPKEQIPAFLQSLTTEEQKQLDRAVGFWKNTLMAGQAIE
jgi:hypothetical protein